MISPKAPSVATAAASGAANPGTSGRFSAEETRLIAKAEQAIEEGRQLERWYRDSEPRLQFFPLDLKVRYRLPNKAQGFFSTLAIGGGQRSVMGCRQEVEFGRYEAANLAERLLEFVQAEFQPRARLLSPEGVPRGFEYESLLHRHPQLGHQRFSTESRSQPLDWRRLGRDHEWVLQRVEIHNFIFRMGFLAKKLPEAAFIVPHADFVHVVENPSPDCALEVSFGYPFADVAPYQNFFGFGPGKFGVAVKLFSFFLSSSNQIRVRMVFAAAPRAQKVFDFGKSIPDPVYGGAKLLRYLTLGLLKPEAIHDRMDAQMLALHCQVHQDLMDQLEPVWREWLTTPESQRRP